MSGRGALSLRLVLRLHRDDPSFLVATLSFGAAA